MKHVYFKKVIDDIISNYGRATPAVCKKVGAKTNAPTCIGWHTADLVNAR